MVAGVRVSSFLFLMLVLVVLGFLAQELLSMPGNNSSAESTPAGVQN